MIPLKIRCLGFDISYSILYIAVVLILCLNILTVNIIFPPKLTMNCWQWTTVYGRSRFEGRSKVSFSRRLSGSDPHRRSGPVRFFCTPVLGIYSEWRHEQYVIFSERVPLDCRYWVQLELTVFEADGTTVPDLWTRPAANRSGMKLVLSLSLFLPIYSSLIFSSSQSMAVRC